MTYFSFGGGFNFRLGTNNVPEGPSAIVFFSHTSVRIRTPAEGVNFHANSHTRAVFVKFSHTTDLTENLAILNRS